MTPETVFIQKCIIIAKITASGIDDHRNVETHLIGLEEMLHVHAVAQISVNQNRAAECEKYFFGVVALAE